MSGKLSLERVNLISVTLSERRHLHRESVCVCVREGRRAAERERGR